MRTRLKDSADALIAARTPSPARNGIFEEIQDRLRPIDASTGSIPEGEEHKEGEERKEAEEQKEGRQSWSNPE